MLTALEELNLFKLICSVKKLLFAGLSLITLLLLHLLPRLTSQPEMWPCVTDD